MKINEVLERASEPPPLNTEQCSKKEGTSSNLSHQKLCESGKGAVPNLDRDHFVGGPALE